MLRTECVVEVSGVQCACILDVTLSWRLKFWPGAASAMFACCGAHGSVLVWITTCQCRSRPVVLDRCCKIKLRRCPEMRWATHRRVELVSLTWQPCPLRKQHFRKFAIWPHSWCDGSRMARSCNLIRCASDVLIKQIKVKMWFLCILTSPYTSIFNKLQLKI